MKRNVRSNIYIKRNAVLGRSKASDQAKETARIKICEAIRRAKRPPSNVTKDEREAWKELKKNKTIQILQADKGNATVVRLRC